MTLTIDAEGQDIQLTCRECHSSFTWTAGEQRFYRERGLQNQPRRCHKCRQKKVKREPQSGAWHNGTVIRLSHGYGFICTHELALEKDIFIHRDVPGFHEIAVGQRVQFELALTPKGPAAANVRVIEQE